MDAAIEESQHALAWVYERLKCATHLVLETDLPGALVVPQKSTFDVQGELYVYVLDADNTPRARKKYTVNIDIEKAAQKGVTVDNALGSRD